MAIIYPTQTSTTTQTTITHVPINQANQTQNTTPVTEVALPKLKLVLTPTELEGLTPYLLKLDPNKLDPSKLDPKILEQFINQK